MLLTINTIYKKILTALFISLLLIVVACKKKETDSTTPTDSDQSGGSLNTSYDYSSNAFGDPLPTLSDSALALHQAGDDLFDDGDDGGTFVPAPAAINPGLGPIYNNNACGSCHVNDGKGILPSSADAVSSLLFRLSISGTDPNGGPNPIPAFGTQLQNKAIPGVMPEGQVSVSYIDSVIAMLDGSTVTLKKPVYTFLNTYTGLPSQFMYSPRMAPFNFGLGLLEAINEQTLLNFADPNDNNGDSISGRPNYVYDIASNKTVIGRFGWKANQSSLMQQTATAFNQDMGVTSPLIPVKSCYGQPQYDTSYCTCSPDITSAKVNAVTFYLQTLAVPARRNVNDNTVQQGKSIFIQANCSGCHIPSLTTGSNPFANIPSLTAQTIQPFTDLLLHDMGPGLADGRTDYEATGTEWRTAPLWGIGLLQIVNGNTVFLHDGRARSLMEAIMWHSGEAEKSKQYVRQLSENERNALITFLQSL